MIQRNLLEIKRSGKIDVVPGMTIIQVDGPKDFGQLYGYAVRVLAWSMTQAYSSIASRERKTASTKLNDSSSRSHAVLMLHLTIHDTLTGKRYQSKLKVRLQLSSWFELTCSRQLIWLVQKITI